MSTRCKVLAWCQEMWIWLYWVNFSIWIGNSMVQLLSNSWQTFYKFCQAGVFPKLLVTLIFSIIPSSSLGSSWSTQCQCWPSKKKCSAIFFKFLYSLTLDSTLISTSTVCFTLDETCTQFARVPGDSEHLLHLLNWIYKKQSDLYGSSLYIASKVSTVLCSSLEVYCNLRFRVPGKLEQPHILPVWRVKCSYGVWYRNSQLAYSLLQERCFVLIGSIL